MSFFRQNRWMLLLLIPLCFFYLHFLKAKKEELNLLSMKLHRMQKQKLDVLQTQEELMARIASQNDPAWIELVLMRDLGVVPEGFLKVHFKK